MNTAVRPSGSMPAFAIGERSGHHSRERGGATAFAMHGATESVSTTRREADAAELRTAWLGADSAGRVAGAVALVEAPAADLRSAAASHSSGATGHAPRARCRAVARWSGRAEGISGARAIASTVVSQAAPAVALARAGATNRGQAEKSQPSGRKNLHDPVIVVDVDIVVSRLRRFSICADRRKRIKSQRVGPGSASNRLRARNPSFH